MSQKLGTNILAGASNDIDNIIPSRAFLVLNDGVTTNYRMATRKDQALSRDHVDINPENI